MKNSLKNIVIIRTDRIGEVLLSTVAVDAIKEAYPDATISFVTSEYSRPLVEGSGDVAEILTAHIGDRKGWLREARRLGAQLKSKKFDAAVVMNPHKAIHLACFLAGIPIRVGYDRKWGFLLNKKIEDKRHEGAKHEIEYTGDLLRLLGVERAPKGPKLKIDPAAENEIKELTANIDTDKPVIAVHPGSSNPAKMWAGDNYAELIDKIKTECDSEIVVIGSEDEKLTAEAIIDKSGIKAHNLAGKFDLKELAAFISKCDLFIGNDTGPMHMAAALGVPVIAIFGRNIPGVSPRRWGPWGKNNVVFHENPGCDPCYDSKCPYEYKCLKAVTVDAVFEAVKEKIKAVKKV